MVALPNFNPVEGLLTDASGALTIFGQLRQLVAQTILLPKTQTPTSAITALAAANTNTGIDLPAGQKIRAIHLLHHGAGANYMLLGIGTAAAAVAFIHFCGVVGNANCSLIPYGGYDYGTNTRVWINTNAVVDSALWTVWTST
jgi:hypothetical protein